ncbi:MAG: SAVED domain-containing protein [Deltaproteobacteria bacterium]|nr:SAVED domain-containing protein [Deltaproteobacteria bacterium]
MAKPQTYPHIELDREFKRIGESIKRSRADHYIELWPYPNATREDLDQAILAGPDILHIAGHGRREGIVLHGRYDDDEELISLDDLSELLSWHTPRDRPLQCAVLNACWSADIGLRRALWVPFTVGMKEEVYDPAAVEFTCGFYDALGAGRDYIAAFQHGRLRGRRYAGEGKFQPLLLQSNTGKIGIRSFMLDADDLGEQTELFLQLEHYFEGRTLRPGHSWRSVANEVARFCADPELRHRFRSEDFQLYMDCHLTIAFLAGYMFGFEAPVAPLQGRHRKEVWARPSRPTQQPPRELQVSARGPEGASQLAVSVSLSRGIIDNVQRYLADKGDFRIIDISLPYPNPRPSTAPSTPTRSSSRLSMSSHDCAPVGSIR